MRLKQVSVRLDCSCYSFVNVYMRWLRRGALLALISAIFCFVMYSPIGTFILMKGLVGFVPEYSGESAEAITVLGRGTGAPMQSRIDVAAELLELKRAPFTFVSGNPVEAREMAKALYKKGIFGEAVRGEGCSFSTEENALFTAAILLPQGIDRILLLTDAPHLLRATLVFKSLGFDVTPVATPLWLQNDSKTLNELARAEVWKLLGYALLGRFNSRSFDSPKYVRPEQLNKLQSGGCAVQSHELKSGRALIAKTLSL